jgi:hypothetical protein
MAAATRANEERIGRSDRANHIPLRLRGMRKPRAVHSSVS